MNYKMLYIFIISLFICIFCGCTAKYGNETSSFKLPPELQNYKIISLMSSDGTMLYVLVKSNENREVIGTMKYDKNPIHTIVIDDVEYVRKNNEKN